MTSSGLPSRIGERAAELFQSGWNCAESVFLAIHEQVDDGDPPVHLLTALGGGFGNRKTCGALTGAMVALGLVYGRKQINPEAKKLAYAKARELYWAFQQKFHCIDCWELTNGETAEDERKRICTPLVAEVADMVMAILDEEST